MWVLFSPGGPLGLVSNFLRQRRGGEGGNHREIIHTHIHQMVVTILTYTYIHTISMLTHKHYYILNSSIQLYTSPGFSYLNTILSLYTKSGSI